MMKFSMTVRELPTLALRVNYIDSHLTSTCDSIITLILPPDRGTETGLRR